MSLIEKLRKARETKVEAGGFTFIVRRPTDVEMMELGGTRSVARLFPFIVGWDGVSSLSMGIPGGDAHPLPFDGALCGEWLADRPDLFGPLVEAILGSYAEHAKALESTAKN